MSNTVINVCGHGAYMNTSTTTVWGGAHMNTTAVWGGAHMNTTTGWGGAHVNTTTVWGGAAEGINEDQTNLLE